MLVNRQFGELPLAKQSPVARGGALRRSRKKELFSPDFPQDRPEDFWRLATRDWRLDLSSDSSTNPSLFHCPLAP